MQHDISHDTQLVPDFGRDYPLILPFFSDADLFLHSHRLSHQSLYVVEADQCRVLLQRLPKLITPIRTQIIQLANQENARQFYTKLYIRMQMATQRIFDPLYSHHEHFVVTDVPSDSSTSLHQPHSFRELPLILQQLLVELCCKPSIRSSGLDSIIECYDFASFLRVSVCPYHSPFQSAFDTCLAEPFPYQGEPFPEFVYQYPTDWTMTHMREAANRASAAGKLYDELLPWTYMEYDMVEGVSFIEHVDSCSSFTKETMPDHWVSCMIDLMRNRVIWIGATNRGDLIGIARDGFDELTHRKLPEQSTACTCQTISSPSSDWNGPVVVWDWTNHPVRLFTSHLSQLLNLEVENDYVLRTYMGRNPEYDERERRFRIIDRTKQSASWQAWQDQMMNPLSSASIMQLNRSMGDRQAVDSMSAEVVHTTLTAYVEGFKARRD